MISGFQESETCHEHIPTKNKISGFCIRLPAGSPLRVTCNYSSVSVYLKNIADYRTVRPFIQALDWLCRVLRKPAGSDGAIYSRATYQLEHHQIPTSNIDHHITHQELKEYTLQQRIHLVCQPLVNLTPSCWQHLFESYVIVDSAVPLCNKHGHGLEMSFDLMISLTAVECCLEIGGGIIFAEYQTIVFPTAIQDDFAQFHFTSG